MLSRRTSIIVLFGCFVAVAAITAFFSYRFFTASDHQQPIARKASAAVSSTIAVSTPRIMYMPKAQAGPFRIEPADSMASMSIERIIARAHELDGLAILELSQRAIRCRMLEQALSSGSIDQSEDTSAASQLADCAKLPKQYAEDPIDWVRRAAEAGVIEAQVAYPALASQELTPEVMARDPRRVERYKTDSMRYLKHAASAGSVDALNELAHSYQQGVITRSDPVLSYAYMSAANRSGLVPSSDRLLSAWRQKLTPEQQTRAGAISNRIYQECCS